MGAWPGQAQRTCCGAVLHCVRAAGVGLCPPPPPSHTPGAQGFALALLRRTGAGGAEGMLAPPLTPSLRVGLAYPSWTPSPPEGPEVCSGGAAQRPLSARRPEVTRPIAPPPPLRSEAPRLVHTTPTTCCPPPPPSSPKRSQAMAHPPSLEGPGTCCAVPCPLHTPTAGPWGTRRVPPPPPPGLVLFRILWGEGGGVYVPPIGLQFPASFPCFIVFARNSFLIRLATSVRQVTRDQMGPGPTELDTGRS